MQEAAIRPAEADPLPPPRARWTRDPVSIAWRIALGILILIFLAWLILLITKGRFLKPTFEKYASSSAQREVKVAGDFQLFFNPINIKFLAEGLTISNPQWATRPNLFEAKKIDTNIATFTLLFGKRRVNWLDLTNGALDLEWDSSGRRNTWTLGDPDKRGEPFELPLIRRAQVAGTTVRYSMPSLRLTTDLKVDTVRARDTAFESDIRFSGNGTLRDERFTLSGSLMSPNETVRGGRNRIAMRADARSTRLEVSGDLAGPTELEGARLKTRLSGYNMAVAMDMIGIAMPETRRYVLNSNLTKVGEEWRFTGLTGRWGDSDVAGRMTMTMPADRLHVDADLSSKVVDIIDLGPFMGYDPQRLDAGKVVMTGPGGRPRLLPDASLRIEAISRFDADVRYRVARIRAESMPISNIALTLDLDRSLMKLSPLTFDMAGGHVASDISINARARPVVTGYDIRLSPTPMGTLLARWGAERSGTTGTIKARIQMEGRGDSVHQSLASSNGRIAIIMPKGNFWARNVQLSELDIGTFAQKMFEGRLKEPVAINCGLIAFTVRDGIAAADPILIDTQKNLIVGRGGFSFKDESIDIGVEADSKRFSLLSGQSPVGVGGYFAEPSVNPISGELLARVGVGLGLGALLTPVAAVISFIDLGDGEDTQCGPVLAGKRAVAQRQKDGDRVEAVGAGKDTRKQEKKKFLGIF